jgi:hypothetical protein
MKKIWLFCLMTIPLVFSLRPIPGQEEPIKESVSVTNVEVPVRVLSKNQAVAGLQKEDFRIFEDGRPQTINGFYSLRKKIAAAAEEMSPDVNAPQLPAGRYFVLVYRLYEFNQDVQDSLDYLFRNLFQPDDQLLVLANKSTLAFTRLGSDERAQSKISELIKSESLAQYNRLLTYLQQIETSLNMTQFKMALRSREDLRPEYLNGFLQAYLETWKDFKRNYLRLDIDKYYYFARYLEGIRKQKWVLNFYQLEQFPQIAFGGQMEQQLRSVISEMESSENPTVSAQGRIIRKLKSSIDMEMKVADDFPSEEVSKLFYKVNATFHSFFMRMTKDTGGKELQFSQVATDIENSLRQLSEKTGGALLASNDLADSLAQVAQKEDVVYMLTYEPSNPKKIGKIKVTVANKKYDVLYDNNIRADYIAAYLEKKGAENPSISITGLSFREKKLSLSAVNFSRTAIQGETVGRLLIRIRIKNAENQTLFDQAKELKVQRDSFSLTLSFDFLTAGKYDVIIDLRDQLTGKSCTEVLQPLVE